MPKKTVSATASGELERLRKIGERPETITVELTPEQIEEEKGRVVDLLGRRNNLLASVKSLKADYKAKIENVDAGITLAVRAATTGKVDLEVTVEEWLTKGNEVVRMRADTGEVLGRRTARASDLQESLAFENPTPPDPGDDFPTAEDAFGGS